MRLQNLKTCDRAVEPQETVALADDVEEEIDFELSANDGAMSVHPCQETDIDIKPSISSLKGSLGRRVKCRYSITSIQDEQ